MDGNWIISVSLGVALVGAGSALMRSHRRAWREQKNDPDLDHSDRQHFSARYRRRMQASGILTLLGVMIPVGDVLIPWRQFLLLFAFYWGAVILLAFWVILLGAGDALATAAHSRVALSQIHRKQKQLEHQIDEIRRRQSNGRGKSK